MDKMRGEPDFIYPTCPECGNKASDGEGVSGWNVLTQPFDWYCKECKYVHTGVFNMQKPQDGVLWHEKEKASLLLRIKLKLFG